MRVDGREGESTNTRKIRSISVRKIETCSRDECLFGKVEKKLRTHALIQIYNGWILFYSNNHRRYNHITPEWFDIGRMAKNVYANMHSH